MGITELICSFFYIEGNFSVVELNTVTCPEDSVMRKETDVTLGLLQSSNMCIE